MEKEKLKNLKSKLLNLKQNTSTKEKISLAGITTIDLASLVAELSELNNIDQDLIKSIGATGILTTFIILLTNEYTKNPIKTRKK